MAKAPPTAVLAKISPPRLRNAYLRERLLQELERLRDRSLIWLAAPAGYGKSTVVASWLQARDVPAIWYHCDSGDADIASFFHFLALAVLPVARASGRPLPPLALELYPELDTFVRNYFREMCARLPKGTCIVLDNWQDVPQSAALRAILPVAVGELPAGITLVVVSRQEPDANLSRLGSTERMAIVGRDALELSDVETAGIAALYEPPAGHPPAFPVRELHVRCQGWAAGLAALLRHPASTVVERWDSTPAAMQAVFDYLSAEIFERLQPSTQEFLMRTACLEHIAAPVAQELTGNARARAILDLLVRDNVFTQQRPAAGTYYYHPLFRQFLQGRVASEYGAVQHRDLLNAAALALEQNGDAEAAIPLRLKAGNWPQAVQLVVGLAPALVAQGRSATVAEWMAALPDALRTEHPWLMYWHGIQQLATAFPLARPTLERAYQLFGSANDDLGQMLAVAAILQHHYYSYVDFSPMLPWIDALEASLLRRHEFPSPTLELAVVTGLCSALMLCTPESPRLTWCTERMKQLMQTAVEPRAEAAAVTALMHYFAMNGLTEQARELAGAAERLAAQEELGPAARLEIFWVYAFYLHVTAERPRVQECLGAAIAITRHHNLAGFEHRLRVSLLQTASATAQSQALADELARMESMAARLPPILSAHEWHVRSMFCLARGDLEAALGYAQRALATMATAGWKTAHALCTLGIAEILCEMGRLQDSVRYLTECAQLMTGVNSPLMAFSRGLVEAEIARRQGLPEEFKRRLANTIALARAHGFAYAIHANSVYLSRLIPHALELGIETDYCLGVIRKHALSPPSRDVARWPWPVRIRTLGHFEVRIDGEPIAFQGRPQHKPFDLLKNLLVQREGVESSLLMERLWPDLDGDSARNALDLALHRLRKLLRHKDAVILDQGRIQLDREQVWVDAFTLMRLCEAGHAEQDLESEVEQLLQLYSGAFLPDQDQPWTFAVRERLRSMFIRRVGVLARSLEEERRWAPLTDLYRRAVEVDPVAEEFYRGLIHCYSAQGRIAEARATYLRCKESLNRLLGVEPSAPTREVLSRL